MFLLKIVKIIDLDDSTYIIRSEGRCLRHMCQRIMMVVYYLFFGHEVNQVEIVFVILNIILTFLVGQL